MRKLTALALVLVLLAAAGFAVDVVRADWAYFRAEKALARFRAAGDQRTLPQLGDARHAIDRALALWPDNPHYLSLDAQVLVWEGHLAARDRGDPSLEISHYRQAIAQLHRALRLRPAHARTWALLAEYKIRVGERDGEWHTAREKALELGGSDPKLVARMMRM